MATGSSTSARNEGASATVRAKARIALVALLPLAGLAFAALATAGCHESDLEPASPLRGDWSMRQAEVSASALSPEVPALYVPNPAPIAARPRSISLGYIGDGPLTPTAETAPRWPLVQEPFHMRGGYAYGYGHGARRVRRRWR